MKQCKPIGRMKSVIIVLFTLCVWFTAAACSGDHRAPETLPAETLPAETQTPETEPTMEVNYMFQERVTEEVLRSYLCRAVTISCESGESFDPDKHAYIKDFILHTGAKYICRAACIWSPSVKDYDTYENQKRFIDSVHTEDPDVVFEACVFECVGESVNEIPIPAWVFEAFGQAPEERCFSYDRMIFTDGSFLNQWGEGLSVPDMTRQETQLFFYYRACRYIDIGYEGLHLGQVNLMGKNDTGWESWTKLLKLIRAYAKQNAHRSFVFINAHTHGLVGSDGVLLFDFHMYPMRVKSDTTQKAHFPTETDPQKGILQKGYSDSIYGKSLGGKTVSGWECDHLPYLVELDNFGDKTGAIHTPTKDGLYVWGMDEITWFANQPDAYRAEWLSYAVDWVMKADGNGYFAMPGQRVARLYKEDGNVYGWRYYAFNISKPANSRRDEDTIAAIWAKLPIN